MTKLSDKRASRSNVYTIPPGTPFVDVLATGIRDLAGDEPENLTRCTVMLPTQRARRALQEAFLRQSAGRALLLPKLVALGELDEDELALSQPLDETTSGDIGHPLSVPPAMPGIRRRLLLARMIMSRPDINIRADQAAWLAAELARLLDQVHTEQLSFDKLASLVPDEFAEHWQITLTFLEILTDAWPKILEEEGCIDPADRRNRLLETQATLWRREPPDDLIIAAGSTGTIPATADLLKVIAGLPHGMVVLPGFDADAGPAIWDRLSPTHPQYTMVQLLDHLGVDPSDVIPWPYETQKEPAINRLPLIRRALAPAGADLPGDKPEPVTEETLNGLTRIDCPTPQEEAKTIALMMRETLETPGKTAALITPDRVLARRVAAALKRWNIEIDDSAGVPLAQSPPGTFLRLSAHMAAENLAPVPLLAALKHPFAGGGMPPGKLHRDIRKLESAILRGPRPAPGIAGLRLALRHKKESLDDLLAFLEQTVQPFHQALRTPSVSLRDIMRAHIGMAEKLASTDQEEGAQRLWAKEDGEAAMTLIAELSEAADDLGPIDGTVYPALLDTLLSGAAVRPRYGQHPRLFIWGLLEARLQRADVMILGSLNENAWPPEAKANPWMSRPMLSDFGLPLPERRIGLTAHDFTQAFCAPHVILTRAERVDGTPSMPSRWLLRLENLIEANGWQQPAHRESAWMAWSQALDAPAQVKSVSSPKPTPPVDVRPRELSVSRIETWVRDPYAIYAQYILNLKPLPNLEEDPGARDRGIIIHDILDDFIRAHPKTLPDDAFGALIKIGQTAFEPYAPWPNIKAFWWPRFEIIAEWFIHHERRRREKGYTLLAAETKGDISLNGPAGLFTITARADRIDKTPAGTLAILDYKTGQPPTEKMANSGIAPQLPLEAIIAERGGFASIPETPVGELTIIHLSGGREPGKDIPYKDDIKALIKKTASGLQKRIDAFDRPETPYLSRATPMFLHRTGDYDHLARVKEWSSGSGDDQ